MDSLISANTAPNRFRTKLKANGPSIKLLPTHSPNWNGRVRTVFLTGFLPPTVSPHRSNRSQGFYPRRRHVMNGRFPPQMPQPNFIKSNSSGDQGAHVSTYNIRRFSARMYAEDLRFSCALRSNRTIIICTATQSEPPLASPICFSAKGWPEQLSIFQVIRLSGYTFLLSGHYESVNMK